MKKMSSLLALAMSACVTGFLITADAVAQKTQDRMPSPPGGRGGLPDGVTSRAPRAGEVFNDSPGSAESRKADRWQRDNDGGSSGDSGGSAASRKQDRLTPSPNAVNNPDRRARTATGYGYGPRSRTPKIQDRLTPDPNYGGPETIYRYGGQLATPYPNLVGRRSHYDARYLDFILRNQGLRVRDPYYEFGSKYYDRYRNYVARSLTPSGQAFVSKVGPALQRLVEERLRVDPVGFTHMERDPVAFSKFVTEIHVKAYYDNGWHHLHWSDQRRIVGAIDGRDLMGRAALAAAAQLTPGLFGFNPTRTERPQYNPYSPQWAVPGRPAGGRRYRYRY